MKQVQDLDSIFFLGRFSPLRKFITDLHLVHTNSQHNSTIDVADPIRYTLLHRCDMINGRILSSSYLLLLRSAVVTQMTRLISSAQFIFKYGLYWAESS